MSVQDKIILFKNVASFFELIFTNNGTRKIGDVLIIAGDIGHYNDQNIEVLKILQKKFYKHIICVLGNHDYYLVNGDAKYTFENNSFKRVENLRKLINNEKNIYCLDGNIVEIDGSKFYKDGTMKYWVFGHTHDPMEYKIENVKFLCNPLGYPNESNYEDNIKMKSFEI